MSKKNPKTYNHYVPQFYLKIGRKEFVDEVAIRDTAGRDFNMERIVIWRIGFGGNLGNNH